MCPAAPFLAWKATDPRVRRVIFYPKFDRGLSLIIQLSLTREVTLDLLYDGQLHPEGMVFITDMIKKTGNGFIAYGAQNTSQLTAREAVDHLLGIMPAARLNESSATTMFEVLGVDCCHEPG